MPSTKVLKQRIRSVKNTAQITKAMEAVSATKMRKSQEFALRARPYAVASLEMLRNILSRTSVLPPLLSDRPVKTSLLLVVTSDKGLAGAFNTKVLGLADEWIAEKRRADAPFTLVTVGKKARDYFTRRAIPLEQNFWNFGDYSRLQDTLPVAQLLVRGFENSRWDEVKAVYTHFRTTLRQDAVLRRLLPATREGIEEIVASIVPERGRFAQPSAYVKHSVSNKYLYEYKFEPSPEEILNTLVPQLLYMHIHHIILESNASEHSARMVAMKNASESAEELIRDLTLVFNKARQAGITRELAEITAGREALEQ